MGNGKLILFDENTGVAIVNIMAKTYVAFESIEVEYPLASTCRNIRTEADYIFVRYEKLDDSVFYVIKAKIWEGESIKRVLSESAPNLSADSWGYHGHYVKVLDPEDVMLLTLSHVI